MICDFLFYCAVHTNNFSLLQMLTPFVSISFNNNYALRYALSNNVTPLIDYCVDLMTKEQIIYAACQVGHINILQKVSAPNTENYFICACRHGQLKVVKYLYNVHKTLHDEYTCLVACHQHKEVIHFIMSKTEKILELMIEICREGNEFLFELILEHDIAVNDRAFCIAIKYSPLSIVQKFLEKYPHMITTKNQYAIKYAALSNNCALFELLCRFNADIRAEDDYSLRVACLFNNMNIVKYIIKSTDIDEIPPKSSWNIIETFCIRKCKERGECSICMTHDSSQMCKLTCNHIFHYSCYYLWKGACPNCRRLKIFSD